MTQSLPGKRGLSLRTKILLLLTLVPVVTLGLFVFIALGVFENDKVAYVFESTSTVSRTLSAQVTTDLNSKLTAARPLIREFLYLGKFGGVSKNLFEADSPLEWISAYSLNGNQVQKLDIAEKDPGEGSAFLTALGDLSPVLRETQISGRVLRVPYKDDRVLFVEKVASPQGEKFFIFVAKLKSLTEVFRSPQSSEVYLVNEKAFVLFGSSGSEATYLTEKVQLPFLEQIRDQKFQSGTEEVLDGNHKAWLASFSRVPFANLMVVSLVPKVEALKAVQVLIKKSLVFFLLMISITVVVSMIASGSLTSALTGLSEATQRVAEGHFDIRVDVKSKDEIGVLAASFNTMAAEVSRLMLETAEKSRMESELKTAQTVQETLFPAPDAVLGNLRISGFYEPASECGGDWWHYCQIGDKVFLWIGDATGHGAPAALITSAAKSAATIIERLNVEPSVALSLLNRAIYDVSKGRIMMTFFLASFDLKTKVFTYANASHESPYLMSVQDEPLKKKNLVPLTEANNPRLGQARDTEYQQTTVQLKDGDRIFLYTDGIPDIQNPQNEAWGEREFIKALVSVNQKFPPVAESVAELKSLFSIHRQKAALIDDITYFMVEVLGEKTT